MRASEEVKRLAAKIADGSLPADEPLFVLRGKDRHAARTVRYWASMAATDAPPDLRVEAMALASQMDAWPVKQVPGRPETRTVSESVSPG